MWSDVRGVIWEVNGDPTVFIVADQMNRSQDIRSALVHEVVGHFGMEKLLGDDLRPLLAKVYTERNNPVYQEYTDQVQKDYPNATEDIFASEMIAKMAESRARNPIMTRVIAAIRKFLKSVGFHLSASYDEVMEALAQADRKLSSARKTPSTVDDDTTTDDHQQKIDQVFDEMAEVYNAQFSKGKNPVKPRNKILDVTRPVESFLQASGRAVRRSR